MSPTTPQRGTPDPAHDSRMAGAPSGRTFARRIDCADSAAVRRAAPAPARGGGNRDPHTWEHPSRGD